MGTFCVSVCAFSSHAAKADAFRARLQKAWYGRIGLDLSTLALDDLDEDDFGAVHAAAVLVFGDDRPSHVRAQLAILEEAGIAAMVVLDNESARDVSYARPGTLLVGLEDGDEALAATLRGILHRQREVERLRSELTLAQRFHGGLEGEMARMHEELQLAAMVQREFLPRSLPTLHGVEFAALWRPAHYVSGDIYDITRLDDDHVGLFLADAVGHGVPAALMTMVICRSLTPKIIKGNNYRLVEPSDVLGRLNREMVRRQGGSTRFATAAYALIDCRSRTMRLAGAGHPPPILMSADGSKRELETEGGLLGIFEQETYDQIEVDLTAGDKLIVYSDGFEQAFPSAAGNEYERKLPNHQYRAEFEALYHERDPAGMIRAMGRRLDDQCGSLHQVDDVTLLCMQANPLAKTAPKKAGAVASG